MIKITREQLQKIIVEILSEGKPFGTNLSGLFRQEQTPEEMAAGKKAPAYELLAMDDNADEENTERLIDYGVGTSDDYDIERDVMRTPMTRIRSIPGEAPNPYVPGESYDDTRRRVTRKAEELSAATRERIKQAAAERRAKELEANQNFMSSRDDEGTGVLPYNSSYREDETTAGDTWDLEFEEMMKNLRAIGDDVEFTPPPGEYIPRSDIEDTVKIDRGKRIDETQQLSRGALIRNKYFGRY